MTQAVREAADSIPMLLRQYPHQERVAHRVKRLGLWQSISWRDYQAQVNALAQGLIDLGVTPGERVALIAENRPEWLVADLAIQSIGAISVGVYTTSSAEQLRYVLEHSAAVGLILEGAEQLEKWLELKGELELNWVMAMEPEGVKGVLDWEEVLAAGHERFAQDSQAVEARLQAISPADTALFIYTSGTTGPPKAAMLSHANLLWAIDALVGANPITDKDELLSFLPLSHIVERLITVTAPLKYGYTVSFTENLDTVLQNLQEIRPTVLFAVPRIWEKIFSLIELHMQDNDALKGWAYRWSLKAARRGVLPRSLAHVTVLRLLKVRLGLERVRLAISGAAPISPEILGYFRLLGVDIREGYGMTEGSGLTSIHQGRVKLGTVGEAFPGVELRLVDGGEIVLRSPGVFKGYFKQPEATAEVLQDGWLHTGDIGEFDEDGHLMITDRKKDIIITAGGKNIAPQKLENKLKSSTYIADAVVIGDRRKYLVALLVLDEENVSKWAINQQLPFTTYADLAGNPDIYKLIDNEVKGVNKTLAQVETIKRFAILTKRLYHEDGEVTATLKVKRSSIATKYADLIEKLYD